MRVHDLQARGARKGGDKARARRRRACIRVRIGVYWSTEVGRRVRIWKSSWCVGVRRMELRERVCEIRRRDGWA